MTPQPQFRRSDSGLPRGQQESTRASADPASAPGSQLQWEHEYLDWSPKRRISLPQGAAEEYMLIQVRDFQRLHHRVNRELAPRNDNLPAAYFALFGAAVAVAAAVPPLMTSNNQPSWIIPSFIVSATAFVVLGIVLAIIARMLQKRRREIIIELAEEIHEIGRTHLTDR